LQCVAVCCSVLQCVAVCCSVLQCVAVCCSMYVAGCCSEMQYCCSVRVSKSTKEGEGMCVGERAIEKERE